MWPNDPAYFWPPGIMNKQRVKAFIELFESIGYETCTSGDFEEGFEKVALYTKSGRMTHAAVQLETGEWSSKLGDLEDISHDTVAVVAGGLYGTVFKFMRRRRAKPSASA